MFRLFRAFRATDRTNVKAVDLYSERLRSYPPFTPLHLGAELSKAQAEANLAQIVEAVPERLKLVSEFLQQEQLDPSGALAQNDPRPFLNALWDWGRPRWCTASQPWRQPGQSVSSWRESRRDGNDIILSLLSDIGILLGEILRGFRPEYYWAIVDGREERDMSYYRQPVLKIDAPRPECEPSYIAFDLIDLVIYTCIHPKWPEAAYGEEITTVICDCVLGNYEWSWKGFTIVPPPQSWETFFATRRP